MIFLYGDDNPRKLFPWVHYLLMFAFLVIFILTHFDLGYEIPGFPTANFSEHLKHFGLMPYDLEYLLDWPAITSIFLHISWVSLVLNLFLLWIVGDNVESEFGHLGYLVVFFAFCFLGHLAHFFLVYSSTFSSSLTIGPSAGIAGILGLYLYLFPAARLKAFVLMPNFALKRVYIRRTWALLYWLLVPFFVYLYSFFQAPLLNEHNVPMVVNIHYGVHGGFVLLGALVGILFNVIRGKKATPDNPLIAPVKKIKVKEKNVLEKISEIQSETKEITQLLFKEPIKGREAYLKFTIQNPDYILEPDSQLECAYSFLDIGDSAHAQEVLTRYYENYPNGPYLTEVRLLLGELQSKIPYFYELAQEHLNFVVEETVVEAFKERANSKLAEIEKNLEKIQTTNLQGDEPCVILCQNLRPKKPEKLGNVLACFQNVSQTDALKFITETKGLVTNELSADRAILAAQVIQKEAKVPVLVIPETKLAQLPESIWVDKIELSREGIRFSSNNQQIYYHDFADIHLFCALNRTDQQGLGDVSSAPNLNFDFFVFNPWIRFQFREDEGILQWSKIKLSQGNVGNVVSKEISPKKFVQLLKRFGHNVPTNLGVSILKDRGDWSQATFSSQTYQDWYCRWLLELQSPQKQKALEAEVKV